MALKDTVTQIKDELNKEDSFLKNIIIFEKFYKKNKKFIISIVVVFLLFGIFYTINTVYNNIVIEKTNIAYNKLLLDPKNKDLLNELKSNKPLYNVYIFLQSARNNDIKRLQNISNSDNEILSSIAKFELLIKKDDANLLLKYADNNTILKDYALIQAAFIFIKNRKYKEAKNTLLKISANSRLKNISHKLEHFLITKAL